MRGKGFTLIEIMTTVAIAGILAAVALPNYAESVRRGQRAEACANLMEARHWMEQQFTLNSNYADTALPAGFTQSPKAGAGRQLYEISVSAEPAVTATTYTLLAKRIDAADDKCGNFTIDQSGQRGLAGQKPGIEVVDCWGR